MKTLNDATVARISAFAHTLIDPARARIAIAPERAEKGYWFGGGNMAVGPDRHLYLTGRYRNSGDSRTGLDLGDRGKELSVFSSADGAATWTKVLAFDKKTVAPAGMEALSIEGSAIRFTKAGVELYVSSEKKLPYPDRVAAFEKPGTGIWSIERLTAPTIEALRDASPRTIVSSTNPATLQIKDPFIADRHDGSSLLFFCHHSFSWSSSGTGYMALDSHGRPQGNPVFDCFPRGPAWDVAITRGTCVLPLPRSVAPAGIGLVFYDGGECLRNLDEHAMARKRPRGYSCEELGGIGYYVDDDPREFMRISDIFPEFVSPAGTGSLRYVDVLATDNAWIATWQQSQPDASQALMINVVAKQ